MAQRNHTYLYKQGLWAAEGRYLDNEGREFPVRGESKIKHLEDLWVIEGSMRLFGDEERSFVNNYEVTPFPSGKSDTGWVSFNSALGQMKGRFAIVEDMIISLYGSEDERYRGSECLRQINNHTYYVRGALLDGEKLVSSWSVVLSMISGFKGD